MTILYALLVLFVTMLVTTITTLYMTVLYNYSQTNVAKNTKSVIYVVRISILYYNYNSIYDRTI